MYSAHPRQPPDEVRRWLLALASGLEPRGALPAGSELSGAVAGETEGLLRPLVGPIVEGLRRVDAWDRLEPGLRDSLRQQRDDAVRADLVLERFLLRRLLPAWPADVQVVLLKGAAFGGVLYDPAAPRRSADLDLAVRARDLDAVEGLLVRQGGVPAFDAGRQVSRARLFERTYRFGGALAVDVDLHGAFTEPRLFPVDEPAVWARTVPWSRLSDPRVRVLSPEDTLVYLAVHAFTHAAFSPRTLVDACRLAARHPPEPQRLVATARAWRASTVTYLLLAGLAEAGLRPLEPELAASLAPPRWVRRLAGRVVAPAGLGSPWSLPYRLRQAAALPLLDSAWAAVAFVPRYLGLRGLDLLARLRPTRPRARRHLGS